MFLQDAVCLYANGSNLGERENDNGKEGGWINVGVMFLGE